MKILLVCQEFPPITGGVSVFLQNICIQLSHLGHNVDVLTPFREGGQQMHMGQKYRIYQYKNLRFLSSIVPFYHLLPLYFKKKYDLIFIGHFITTNVLGVLFLKKILGIPYVILSHGNDLHYSISNWMDKPVAYQILSNASLILSNSSATAEQVRKKGYSGTIEILHPGANVTKFRPKIETTEIVRRYNLEGRRVILSVSRLVARKGHDCVLHALSKVVKKIPNIIYLIVGTGEEESRLRNLVLELSLEQYVTFAGYIKKDVLPAVYCAADIFVMPSFVRDGGHDYEGFGIVYSEANACGKPVIGGKSGGIEDAVIDGETGLLVEPLNTDKIAGAIIRLLTDVEYAKQLGENGRRRVEKELSWEKVGERLDKILQKVGKNS